MKQLSTRITSIQPSPTLAVTAKVAKLRAAGKDIIGLGAGEPDFDTPQHIKQAAITALQQGATKYTQVAGVDELREAIAAKFKRENQLEYSTEQITVSSGAKQCIYNAIQALCNPLDEVIIIAPYWVSYPALVSLAGATPVIVNTDISTRFKISPQQLQQAITDKTKLIIFNSPNNPTGMAYSHKELAALAKQIVKHPDIIVLSDDIYEHILWGAEPFANIVMANDNLYERSLVVNSLSKVYAMTGWRIGYAAGPSQLIKAMNKIQGQSTSCATAFAQLGAVAALNGSQQCIKEMVAAFKTRHDFVAVSINSIPNLTSLAGDGTFYTFIDARQLIASSGIGDDIALCERLLEHGIALVPGSAFGAPGYVRLSFATSMELLQQAMTRLKQAVNSF